MSIINSQPLIGASGNQGGAYNLTRSLRFRSSATAFLSRTPASAGNRKTWTWSGWIKRGALDGVLQNIFNNNTTPIDGFYFDTNNTLKYRSFDGASEVINMVTTQVFRDASAWYHIIVAMDTTQATSSNRFKLYVNGVQVTAFSTATYPALNYDTGINSTTVHQIGAYASSSTLDGYLAEVNFIDGQALDASSFGETSTTTGVWIPKAYTGTYGTNGFYLDFEDTTSTTTLGYDAAGSNDWTVNNVSLTSGATYDSMTDVPTLTSATAANYSVWNPINNGLGGTVSFANMRLSGVSGVFSRINSTIGVSSGKWYFEATLTTADSFTSIGIGQNNITNEYPGQDALSYAQTLESALSINNNTQPSYGTAFSSGDVFMCAFDLDTNKLFFGKNGTWFGSSDPATGTNPVYTLTAGTYNAIARPNPLGFSSNAVLDINFGQRPFTYTPPSGFVELNTFNLPTPTIGATASTQANKYFDAKLYTGTGSSLSVTGYGFSPDFVWIKERSGAADHALYDAVRGVQIQLESNTTDAETTETTGLTALNSDGFTVGALAQVNTNTDTYVAWAWDANGAGSSNTDGTITSTVSANTSAGFSVVTYTGTGANATVGHGLGVAPSFIIVKRRNTTGGWPVYTGVFGKDSALELQSTAAVQTISDFWNTANPTSSVFGINGSYTSINASGGTYVAYCFAEVAGYSKFGSYTGNGSTDGPFIYTGFRPKFIMWKRSDGVIDWGIIDSATSSYNFANNLLCPNGNFANQAYSDLGFDFVSNGFKVRGASGNTNASGGTYIYMAFAENPFKYANAR